MNIGHAKKKIAVIPLTEPAEQPEAEAARLAGIPKPKQPVGGAAIPVEAKAEETV